MHLTNMLKLSNLIVLMTLTLPITTVRAEEPLLKTNIAESTSMDSQVTTVNTEKVAQEAPNKSESETSSLSQTTHEEEITTMETTISEENQETRIDESKKSEEDFSTPLSYENPSLKVYDPSKLMAFPPDLVGTWTSHNKSGYQLTITFLEDGMGSILWEHETLGNHTDHFKIKQVEMIGDQLYRYVGGENLSAIGYGGIGGWRVKYDFGFCFSNQQLQPLLWQTGIDHEFDYTQGMYGGIYTKVNRDANPPTVTPLSHQSQKQTVRPTLPKTGEKPSIWLPVIGLALLGGIGYTLLKNRQK